MQFTNPKDHDVRIRGFQFHGVVPPGGVVDIPDAYALPGVSSGGERIPPSIEQLAPQLVPVSEEDKEVFYGTPAPRAHKRQGPPTDEQLMRMGLAPAVAAIAVEKAKREAAPRTEAVPRTETTPRPDSVPRKPKE
jgi:hypothetical protein